MISDRSHHVGSISGPGDGLASLKNGVVNHVNGGIVVGPAAAAAQHQANLMAGMNLINQGFQHQQQQGNHLNNINALQQQHNSLSQMQQQGHAILGSGVSSSAAGSPGNQNNQNYDYAVRLAAEANSKATMEKDYYKAIILYGDAISLHSGDCRFFLNRSYCYAQLELYQLALDDAEDAIKLDPKSGKCFYRKGQALIGLKKYMDAEKAFHEVLRLEPDCPETSKQLVEVRLLSLQSLGFDADQSKMAALKYKSIEEAISALLALRMDDSFSDQTPSQKWPAASSMWDHHSDPHQPPQKVQMTQPTTGSGWAPLTGAQQQQQQQPNGSENNLIGSGLRNTSSASAGVIGSGQSQHQAHLMNGYGSEFSTKGMNGSVADAPSSTSNSSIATSVNNGFSSVVGSNGSAGFYQHQRATERPNSSSPLDKLTDSLLINQQQQSHLSHHHHHQIVMGNNTMNANNSQQSRMMSGSGLMNHPNDQISVFDGSCMSKGSSGGASFSSAAHPSNPAPNHVVVSASHVAEYPKNNTANNFNGLTNSFSNKTSATLTNNQHQKQLPSQQLQHQNQASAVIGSGRHASGGGSSAGHVSAAITIGSFGLTSAVAAGASGLSIGGVGGGDLEPSISPAVSNSDSDSSVTITDPAAGTSANHHYNHHQVMVGAVNYKQQQTPQSVHQHHQQHQQQQIGNRLINGSSSGVAAPAATAAGNSGIGGCGSGSVWGSGGGGGGSAGGTFADIVKKKSAPAAASGSRNNMNNNNNNKKSESALNGRNHHNQPKDQMIGSMMEHPCDMDHPNNAQIKESISKSISNSALISKRPTNIWGYNGLRVANVSPTCSRSTLTSIFSKFGKLKPVERITNKNVENQIWVFYDNPISPVDVIAKYQGVVVPGISLNNTPLKFYFAATDDQKDLKFSRPKQPQDSRGECYYWRTTNCFSRESCSLLHLPSCKNIEKSKNGERDNPDV